MQLCASWMFRVLVKDEQGEIVRVLGDPDPVRLARHIHVYGPEGAAACEHLVSKPAEAVNAVIFRRAKRSSKPRMATRRKSTKFQGTPRNPIAGISSAKTPAEGFS
jgi:hypothetical protein